jgi:hypothetical protein
MKSLKLTGTWARIGFGIPAVAVLALGVVAVPSAVALGSTAQHSAQHSSAHIWYVSASAAANGNGSQRSPFNSLSAVQGAAGAGDTIVVLSSPAAAPPLDGGIALKPGQHLIGAGPSVLSATAADPAPRLTNTTGTANSGDAVELADNTEVSNLVIDGSFRGGIYGNNVTGVDVHGNNVSGQNTSCAAGFLVLPFAAATDTPTSGPAVLNAGVQNGWSAIMIDGSKGHSTSAINHNYVHDGVCGDGIDVRLSGSARGSAQVTDNSITQLPQGSAVHSVMGIGMQAADSSNLTADVSNNSETYIGSANADCEGLFLNTNGSAALRETVNHNLFDHGIGGKSCNGFEDIISSGPSTLDATVQDSTFEDNPGDMFQELNFGTAAEQSVLLSNSRLTKTTIALGNANTNNIGECLWTAETGVGDSLGLVVRNSQLSGCNNGVSALNNVVSPSSNAGPVKSYSIDIANSQIFGNAFDGLFINNINSVNHLKIKVQHSDLTDSAGPAAAFMQGAGATTEDPEIDLGGGALGSAGQNNIYGNAGAVTAENYSVSAQHDWWGTPAGPAPSDITVAGSGRVDDVPFLTSPAS